MEPKPDSPTEHSSRRNFLTGAVVAGAATGLTVPTPAGASEAVNGSVPVNPRVFSFVGGKAGRWAVLSATAIRGDALPAAERVDLVPGAVPAVPDGGGWALRGVTSNHRYTTRNELDRMVAKQAALGRPGSTHAALLPIRKTAKWWELTQDDRRAIFEERSKHVTVGLKYLPAVARRLFHCRDLEAGESFDFLTFFDFSKADATAFDDMLAEMRASEEWKYIDREVDVRLVRVDG